MIPARRIDLIIGERTIVHLRCGGFVSALNLYAENLICSKCKGTWKIPAIMRVMPEKEVGETFGVLAKFTPADVLVIARENGREFVKTVDEAEAEDPKYRRWRGV